MPTNIDYEIFNYCCCCDTCYPKPIDRCQNSWCRQKLRIASSTMYSRNRRNESVHRY